MERTIIIQTEVAKEKFRLVEEYEGFGIYQEVTPYGYYVHQSFAFKTNGVVGAVFVSYSYMNNDIEDIYDYIDNYNNKGSFGFKAFDKGSHFCIHPNGDLYL